MYIDWRNIMAMNITYFVHGTTYDNETKKCTGWLPGELSELGIQQSKDLLEQINDKKFDLIVTSDLKRAVDSAFLTWGDKDNIIQDKRLRECNYGKHNGATKEFVVYDDHIDEPFEDGESLKDVENRIGALLSDLKEKYDGKEIAFVAHRAPQLAIEVITQNKTWEQALKEDWRKKKAWKPGWNYFI